MRTLEAENDFITDFAKYELLEVGAHPRSTIIATIEPTDEPQTYKLTGNVTLHGVERGIQFNATLVRRGDAIDIHAVFKMSRAQFAMKARESDWIIQDDLRITIDFHAGPEQVTIEPLP
jgi:polyisoprenoid-binding protein YceI